MQTPRSLYSSCIIGSYVYNICGVDTDKKLLNSIERLNCNAAIEGCEIDFETVNIASESVQLEKCTEPLVIAIQSTHDILVLGGADRQQRKLGKAFQFHVKSDQVREMTFTSENFAYMGCNRYQCNVISDSKFVGVVRNQKHKTRFLTIRRDHGERQRLTVEENEKMYVEEPSFTEE